VQIVTKIVSLIVIYIDTEISPFEDDGKLKPTATQMKGRTAIEIKLNHPLMVMVFE
jgi:hypothetical protein